MDLLWITLLSALALAALLSALVFSIGLWRVLRALRAAPSIRAALHDGLPQEPPRVCVIIPAHNEEGLIGPAGRSLAQQDYPSLRVVFVLDRCTDGTEREIREAIGDDERFEIIVNETCPEHWAGKPNAVRVGVETSRGAAEADLLLFADADTEFEPDCVRAAVAHLEHTQAGMLTLLSTLTHDRWFERLWQPMAAMELMKRHPMDVVNDESRRRSFANGQFMLFRRDVYERVGGHEAVKDELLEDLAFGRLVKCSGNGLRVARADGLFTVRMYEHFKEFRRGWKRIYIESTRCSPEKLRRAARRSVVVGGVLPPLLLGCLAVGAAAITLGFVDTPAGRAAAVAAIAAAALGLFAWGVMHWILRHTQRAPIWALWADPIAAFIVGGILREGASDLERGRGVEWGGRVYQRPVRQ